jgi:hypothetical protein
MRAWYDTAKDKGLRPWLEEILSARRLAAIVEAGQAIYGEG